MDISDRAYKYAKLYHSTERLSDYLEEVKSTLGNEFVEEATIAWESIDQWEGDINPR